MEGPQLRMAKSCQRCGRFDIAGGLASVDPSQLSEDCLYLNVWVPKTALSMLEEIKAFRARLLPTIIYLHGL